MIFFCASSVLESYFSTSSVNCQSLVKLTSISSLSTSCTSVVLASNLTYLLASSSLSSLFVCKMSLISSYLSLPFEWLIAQISNSCLTSPLKPSRRSAVFMNYYLTSSFFLTIRSSIYGLHFSSSNTLSSKTRIAFSSVVRRVRTWDLRRSTWKRD